MVEDLLERNEESVKIYKPAIPWQHIRCLGEDIVEKEMLIPSYHIIRPQDIGSMISAKIDKVKVFKETPTITINYKAKPKVEIINFTLNLKCKNFLENE